MHVRKSFYSTTFTGLLTPLTSALYHIFCFEKIADFSRVEILDRLEPLTRNNFKFRGVNVGGILDGHDLVTGGVERLVLEWKVIHE
jgi:hypothetical protein